MREISGFAEIELFCKALSAPVRLEILQMLSKREMNLQEIAAALRVTAGAVTAHIKLMERAGVIVVTNRTGIKGMQKVCSVPEKRFMVQVPTPRDTLQSMELEIPVGSYVAYEAHPTCGIVSPSEIIGGYDSPMFFDDPRRAQAALLWFSKGYLEYRIPNYLQATQTLGEISISQELCSETPIYKEEWPSDIYFAINGIELGFWTAPTDYILQRGLYTPSWWPSNHSQHGLLVKLTVNEKGCFIENKKVSGVTLAQLGLHTGQPFTYRISAPPHAEHQGGLTLFGRNFGNYNQNISVSLVYGTTVENTAAEGFV